MAVHDTADPAVLDAMEKIRARAKAYRFSESKRRDLDSCQKYCGQDKPLRVVLASSAKWSSSLHMCECDYKLRNAYLELRSRWPQRDEVSNNLADYVLSRDVAGVLRPFQMCTGFLQNGHATASILLPCQAALTAQMEAAQPVYVSGENQGLLELREGQLHDAARLLRQKLRERLASENCHIDSVRSLLGWTQDSR